MKIRFRFEPRDLWVGVFWDRKPDGLHVVVCLLPMLALTFIFPRRPADFSELQRQLARGRVGVSLHGKIDPKTGEVRVKDIALVSPTGPRDGVLLIDRYSLAATGLSGALEAPARSYREPAPPDPTPPIDSLPEETRTAMRMARAYCPTCGERTEYDPMPMLLGGPSPKCSACARPLFKQ